jgi:hypothetical protein
MKYDELTRKVKGGRNFHHTYIADRFGRDIDRGRQKSNPLFTHRLHSLLMGIFKSTSFEHTHESSWTLNVYRYGVPCAFPTSSYMWLICLSL